MGLEGQGRSSAERGYAMAALLVSIAVMAVLMSAAMPAYRHLAQREKEAELVFRGEQYARAVALFRARNGNAFPPSIDVLVQGKYLRKKYKDPMTKDGEFRIVPVGNPQQAGQRGAPAGGPGSSGRGAQPPPGPPPPNAPGVQGSFVSGGIMGVASKSTQTSIRTYKGQTRYDMWPFTFNLVNRPGGNPGPAAGTPGGRGESRPGIGGPGRRGRGPGERGAGPGGRGRGQRGFIDGVRPMGRGRGPGL
jgi:type II secretory pathway pseudopilin PulG